MFVYSKRIITFANEIKDSIKTIMSNEMRLNVINDRFYHFQADAYFKISVVIYNNKSMLGYFNPDFCELGFHECLMHSSKEQLRNVIRHELAHYMTFITYGSALTPHSTEFKNFCLRMGWGEDVYRATTCLDGMQNAVDLEKSSVFRKVQKLMALATSSNQNEAEQAMIKSQQLLLKHNIESQYAYSDDEEKIFLKRIMKQKREDAKMRAIAKILETFFVRVVYNRMESFTYLEILGSAVNIEIAEYVADFLQLQLDQLWEQAKQSGFKGMVAKNSFFLGIARGYCDKINSCKKEYNSHDTKALMVIEKKLIEATALVYGRLSMAKSSGGYCQESSLAGEQIGRQLNINPAVSGSPKNSKALLSHLP